MNKYKVDLMGSMSFFAKNADHALKMAEEDIKVLSTLKNIKLFKPKKLKNKMCKDFLYNYKPSYLNLSR